MGLVAAVTSAGGAWSVDPAALLVIALASLWYVRAVRRLHGVGGRWPVTRTIAAATTALAAVVATNGWVAANDVSRFGAHAVQHILLGLVIPVGVVLAAPLTLALRTSSPPTRQVLRSWSSGSVLRVACHPVVAGALFTITIVAMYTTPLFERSLTSTPVHVFVHAHLLVVGVLFFWPLIGFDPAPVRVPHPARLGLLLLILPLHALLAVTLMDADPPVGGATAIRLAREAGVDPVAEQRLGAGLLWVIGDLVALAAVAIACYRWYRADTAFTRAGSPGATPMIGTPS
jgi:putative copper resistance protein D